MGTVYGAEDVKLGRAVAIKVLRQDFASPTARARFLREIQLTARLEHPHVVPVHDGGDIGGLLYYVMPLIEGESLRQRLERDGRLDVSAAVAILRDVLDGLAYAHERGVVHRDIKPDNVLLRLRHALVADFGIAKALSDAAGDGLTSANVLLGTPAYMSPEQADGSVAVDHRADLYAIGAMAYEMLTGSPPFHAPSAQRVLAMHLTTPPTPVSERRADLPRRLATAVMRCLEKRPADRWQTAEELREALGRPSGRPNPFAAAGRARHQRSLTTAERLVAVAVHESAAPPYVFGTPGSVDSRGFETEVLAAVAQALGLSWRGESIPWVSALDLLREGAVDMICRGVSITPARMRLVAFSDPYLETTLAWIAASDGPIGATPDLHGRSIGVRGSTVAEEYVRNTYPRSTAHAFDHQAAVVEALAAGRIDAAVDHLPIVAHLAATTGGSWSCRPLEGTIVRLGMLFARGNDALRQAVNGALAVLRRDGTLHALQQRWIPRQG